MSTGSGTVRAGRCRHFRVCVLIAALVACDGDPSDPGAVGTLALNVKVAEASASVDQGRITVQGPTPVTRTVTPGTTETITGLVPGTYTVLLEGLTSGDVDLFGETTGVQVVAGVNRNVSVTLTSFVPALRSLPPSVADGEALVVRFGAVTGGTSYVVEWADDPAFSGLRSMQTQDTIATIHPDAGGRIYIRVRAFNRLGSRGRPSATGSVIVPLPSIPTDQPFLATGGNHSCALDAAGVAYCWGLNGSGQLGNGTFDSATQPIEVAGGHAFVAINSSITGNHVCALDFSGRAFCWGLNSTGQLGNGTSTNANSPVAVAGNITFVSISVSSTHSCGVSIEGKAYCWGANPSGALGDGTTDSRSEPGEVQSTAQFARIAAGSGFTCALTMAGQVYCWGVNSIGQTGHPVSAPRLVPEAVNGLPPMAGITASGFHACAWTEAGQAYCWGRGLYGRLGDGDASEGARTPRQVLGGLTWRVIHAGNGSTCGITSARQAYCWGFGRDGRLGTGNEADQTIPAPVSNLTDVVAISSGANHACAVTASGNARCWGLWGSGAIGNGTTAFQPEPTLIGGPASFGTLSAGGGFSCATAPASPGPAYCWGYDGFGQLGTGTAPSPPGNLLQTAGRHTPTRVVGPSLDDLAAGNNHVCALNSTGAAYCWGQNSFGQLGNGSFNDSPSPVLISGMQFSAISAGYDHTCAIAQGQTPVVFCWGINGFGQLGNGSTNDSPTPVAVPGLPPISAISAGAQHSCAAAIDGRVFCWGRNQFGRLGDGSTLDRTSPVQVQALPAAIGVTAGNAHTCALTGSGAAFCWGAGTFGQLGDDSFSNSVLPVAVAGGISFASVHTSNSHTCGVATDGRGFCWGSNTAGELGNGNFDQQGRPTEILGSLRFVLGDPASGGALQAGIFSQTCGLATSLRIYCWGSRAFGQLGEGVFPVELVPVSVFGGLLFRTQ